MILVTGASGFVGGHFVKKMAATGAPIRALYNSHYPVEQMKDTQAFPNVQWQKADLLDVFDVKEILSDVRQIYHCAGIVSFDPRDKQRMIHANVEMCANLVNAALDAGVEKFLQLSSVAAIGRDGTQREVDEETEWQESIHNSAYGISKYLAELEVWRGIGEGLNAVVINPGIILGAPLQKSGWEHGSPKLMKTAFKEFPFYTDGISSFVGVDDVVALGIRLMETDFSAQRFILSAGNYPFKEIFEKMADALGKKRPHFHASKFATTLVWRWSWLQSKITGARPFITKETARNAQTKTRYSTQKLTTALPDFQFQTINDTIKSMAQSFLNHPK